MNFQNSCVDFSICVNSPMSKQYLTSECNMKTNIFIDIYLLEKDLYRELQGARLDFVEDSLLLHHRLAGNSLSGDLPYLR